MMIGSVSVQRDTFPLIGTVYGIQMLKKKLSAGLTVLALATLAIGAEAATLGELQVLSESDEPFEARLSLIDVDPNVVPLLVRIAPASVYEEQKKPVSDAVRALKIERVNEGDEVRLRVYSDAPLSDSTFPLLIEMNVGGTLSTKSFDVALASAQSTGETQAATESSAVRTETPAQKAARLAEDRRQDREFPNRTARAIVRDYIAVNGFDASSPMRIEYGMTLWSVARVYWPSYRGATMEQVLIGFRDRNPEAFIKGEPEQLHRGARLNPPSSEAVFAINPMEAFREIHGDQVAIPLATQNLIDAQLVNADLAAKVADAQDRARLAGGNPQTVAEAGRTALEGHKAEMAYERHLVSEDGKPLGETRQTLTERPLEAEKIRPTQEPLTATPVEETGPAETQSPVAVPTVESTAQKDAEGEKTNDRWWLPVAVIACLGVLLAFFRRRRSCCAAPSEEEKTCSRQTVTLQKEIPPSTQAQLQALKTTVDEAVKNGTTGGAMGVGTAAFVQAQMEEARENEVGANEDKPHDTAPVEPVMPPQEAVLTEREQAVVAKTDQFLSGVSLELDEQDVGKETEAVVPVQEKVPSAQTTSARDQAYVEALDARIELAEGFIKYNAYTEANEIFDEVMRTGTPEQKARVKAIQNQLKQDGAK